MLERIRFVRGAVSDKAKILPVLSHFYINNGRIQGSDGRMWIDAPCPELDFQTVVPANRFLQAIDTCGGEPSIRFTEAGKMVVERKPFRSILPTQPISVYPHGEATAGKRIKIGADLLDTLAALQPFLATDAERQWATSILFNDGTAFATNSAMIATVSSKALPLNTLIPIYVVNELLRIGTPPIAVSTDDHSMTFFWEDDSWLRMLAVTAEWPIETARGWLKTPMTGLIDVPKGLAAAVDRLYPFCDDPKFPIMYFTDKGLSTAAGEVQAEITNIKGLGKGAFHADNLRPMLKRAKRMLITEKAALFQGDGSFRGIMALLRTA